MLFYYSMQKMSADKRNNKANQQEVRNCSIVGFSQQEAEVSVIIADLRKNFICGNNVRDNRNSLIRRLLSGITNEELENLVLVREGGRAPIPTPRSNVQL